MTPFAQVAVQVPEIPWAAISPELVLFGVGILVLLLDTAGERRLQMSFLVFGVVAAGAGYGAWVTGELLVAGLLALGAAAQFALTALWQARPRMLGAIVAALGFAAGFGVTAWQWTALAGPRLVATESVLGDMVAVDGIALFTRFTVCLVGLVTIPLSYAYLQDRRIHRGEYYPLLLFAATGMTLLASSADLVMVFIAVEVLSLALYILVGFGKRDLSSQEGAFKYFLLGAFASAVLLYGIALVYGATGTTNIAAAGRLLTAVGVPTSLGLAALALLLAGFAFKTALIPFHMWTPDAYQGAPTPVTGFIAAGTKAAAFAAFLRVFVGALAPLQWSWQPVFWVLAALTMLGGAMLAIVQDDLKRMLAYSAITHAGYVLIGLMAATRQGASATLFYVLVYALMSIGSFGVLALLERRQRKAMAIADLAGLGRRHPVPAAMFALFLLSLAGLPGTAGFMAKLEVFLAGIEAGHVGIVVVGVLSSVIAFFFYVRIIAAMFMEEEPEALVDQPLPETPGVSVSLVVASTAVVALGIRPGLVMDLARQAASFAG